MYVHMVKFASKLVSSVGSCSPNMMRSLSIATDKYSWVILGFTPFSRSAIDNNVSESPLYCQGEDEEEWRERGGGEEGTRRGRGREEKKRAGS